MQTRIVRCSWPFVIAVITVLTGSPVAHGQSFLERLEARLGQAAEAVQQAAETPPADAPAADPALPEPAPAESPPAAAPAGRPQVGRPGYLGLVGDDLPAAAGVQVVTVRPGSPAQRAGIRQGDVIVALDGEAVQSLEDMARRLERRWIGSHVEFRLQRGDAERTIEVVLTERPSPAGTLPAPSAAPRGPALQPPTPAETTEQAVLGARVEPVSAALAQRFNIGETEGVVVTGVIPNTPAERYRLPIGGVIVDVNGQAIRSVEEITDLIAAARPGDEWEIAYVLRGQRQRTRVRLSAAGAPLPAAARRAPAPAPTERGLDLGNRLDGGGRRPILGRIGRVLDGVLAETAPPANEPFDAAPADELPPADVAPLDENQPVEPPPTPMPDEGLPIEAGPAGDGEVELLREEVQLLRRELELLRRRVEQLERR